MENSYQIQGEFDDEQLYTEYESYGNDDESYGNDDESLGSFIDAGLNTVGRIVSGGVSNAVGTAQRVGRGIGTILGINPAPASTTGIQQGSNLTGSLQTNSGRQVPVHLPSSIATKQDVNILQGAIRKINGELKKVADTTNNNGVALSKLSGDVKVIDEKHVAATRKQNDLLHKLGRGVDKLEKDLKQTKQQAQMQMMMSMMMQPEIEKIKFAATTPVGNVVTDGTKDYAVTTDSGDDNSMLPMLMMSGGFGGESGGDMSSNPMMMFAMMKAFEK